MAETDYATLEDKKRGDRSVMHVLYGLHTVAPFTMWTLSLIAVVINYVKRSEEADALFVRHHSYMIGTFWWAVLWLVITSPLWLIMFLPGMLAWLLVGAWYLYRYLRGWLRFNDNQLPPT